MKDLKICVVGLGYVGLPLAVEFAKKDVFVNGFDVDKDKISKLKQNIDPSGEVSSDILKSVNINFGTEESLISEANFIIVAVPTPINDHNQPDLKFVKSASEMVGKNISKGSIVVYESTVYPGVTEEICCPIIEKFSGFNCGVDFKIGYSPERINPGDKKRTVDKIVKIVSGMDSESLDRIASVYKIAIKAGVFRAKDIKSAEAAKVIENVQRDINIALMNELAVIFDKSGLDIDAVLAAAGSKWNFHKYHPGLVGGHCIGIDPFYLVFKSEEVGHYPEMILTGRRINDNMHKFYASKIIKKLISEGCKVKGAKVLIMGLTFKPNVSDYRNSRVKNLIEELQEYGVNVYAVDPMLNSEIIAKFNVKEGSLDAAYDLKVLAVKHDAFADINGVFELI
jgi:UDP-N-acetyl-D-galactosamine dehydrogenase